MPVSSARRPEALPGVPATDPSAKGTDAASHPQEPAGDPPPTGPGACPKPARKIQQLFANALKVAEESSEKEPQRAIAESIRLRLDELFNSGCGVRLNGKQLNEQVALISEDPAKRENFGVGLAAGYPVASYYSKLGAGIALYEWREGKIRTRIVVTHDGADLEKQLMLLDFDVLNPPGSKAPLLALVNTHPWMASCWRRLRMRVFEPSGDPDRPTVLLDHHTSGRWCEGVGVTAAGNSVSFTYQDWFSVLRPLMERQRNLSFEYQAGSLVRRFGFPREIHQLVDEWLSVDWAQAKQATVLSKSAELEPVHARLTKAVKRALAREGAQAVSFSSELFPGGNKDERRLTAYCALSDDDRQPCKDWPKPVDIMLEWNGSHWLIGSVKPR